MRDRLLGVERVEQAALPGRAGHELGDALRAGRADHADAERALAPDQPRQERHRQVARLRRPLDQPAQRLLDGLGRPSRGGRARASRGGGGRARRRADLPSPSAGEGEASRERGSGEGSAFRTRSPLPPAAPSSPERGEGKGANAELRNDVDARAETVMPRDRALWRRAACGRPVSRARSIAATGDQSTRSRPGGAIGAEAARRERPAHRRTVDRQGGRRRCAGPHAVASTAAARSPSVSGARLPRSGAVGSAVEQQLRRAGQREPRAGRRSRRAGAARQQRGSRPPRAGSRWRGRGPAPAAAPASSAVAPGLPASAMPQLICTRLSKPRRPRPGPGPAVGVEATSIEAGRQRAGAPPRRSRAASSASGR